MRDHAGASASKVVTCPSGMDIGQVLDAWSSGQTETAVSDFLAMAKANSPQTCFRPYPYSEASFIALPRDEQEVLKEEMAQRYSALNKFARELGRRANEASNAGSLDRAREIIDAMDMLADANRGEEVTLLAALAGEAIRKYADKTRMAINGPNP